VLEVEVVVLLVTLEEVEVVVLLKVLEVELTVLSELEVEVAALPPSR
jgi:hypothetical protein